MNNIKLSVNKLNFCVFVLLLFICNILEVSPTSANEVKKSNLLVQEYKQYAINKDKVDIRRKSKSSPRIGIPSPKIKLHGFEKYESGGFTFESYKLLVTNFNEFNNELFSPAPSLPPCRFNENSSRAWVTVYDNYDRKLNGFCALKSNLELKDTMSFMYRADKKKPKKVYIEIIDRKENIIYRSNLLRLK